MKKQRHPVSRSTETKTSSSTILPFLSGMSLGAGIMYVLMDAIKPAPGPRAHREDGDPLKRAMETEHPERRDQAV